MKRTLPFILYAILILIVFWGVLWPPEGKILFGPDITRYHYWQRQFLGESLKLGSIPWWNPYIFGGQPYLEHPQIPFWYLPNLLFVFIATNKAISWYIAIHIFWAMAGMYTLLRRELSPAKRDLAPRDNNPIIQLSNNKQSFIIHSPRSSSRLDSAKRAGEAGHSSFIISLPAWAAGVAFGLSAYFVSRIPAGHIDIIAASAWMPWVILAFSHSPRWSFGEAGQLSATSKKNIAFAGVVLAIQLLAGHPMVAVFTLEAVLIVTMLLCLPRFTALRAVIEQIPKASSKGLWGYFVKSVMPLLRMALAVLIGLTLAAIQLLPNTQYIAHSIRTFSFPDSWAQLGTPTVGHMLEFLDPFYFYSRLPDSGFGFEHVGYVGKIPLLFALIAIISWIIRRKKSWEVPAFVLVAIFGLWMWLGQNALIDLFSWVRSWMPLYSQIRIPARHIILFVLSASVLFGFGLALVKSKIVQFLVVGFVLVELVPFARHHLSLVPIPEMSEDRELVTILTNDKSLFRFLPNFYHGDPLRDVMEFNAPIAHKIQSISGYDTPPLRNMYEFLLAVNGYRFLDILPYSESIPPFRNISSAYLSFLNVKYVFVPINDDGIKNNTSKQFVLVKENVGRGWRLYENKNVYPRFFIATKIQKEASREAVLAAIGKGSAQARQGSVDPKTTILVDGSAVNTSGFAPDCPAGYQGTVSVTSYGYERIELTLNNPCNGFLATSEVMYPGWRATIDGKEAQVFESNAAFRTLYLPKGTHTIVFSYRPMIVLLGAIISLSIILIIIFSFARPGLAKLIISFFPQFHVSPHR